MRFHYTKVFADKLNAVTVAHNDFVTAFDRDSAGAETSDKLSAHTAAIADCLQHPAVTPTELRLKLCLYRDNNVADWSDRPAARDAFEAMINDTVTMQGHYPGPDMFAALLDWRNAEEIYQYTSDLESIDGEAVRTARSAAFRKVMATPCTTAGDFIAKTYVNLLGLVGHTWFGDYQDKGLGNIFDVNIANEDDERDDTSAFHRAAYFDIDYSDIGANLLAYGLPYFSAEHWMERADAVGLRVGIVAVEGRRTLWQSMDTSAEHGTPAGREVDRLRRIIAFDPIRTSDVMDEIERDWPQLIATAPKSGEV